MTGCLNVSLERVQNIVTVEMSMSCICTRWYIVTPEKEVCGTLLKKCYSEEQNLYFFIIHVHM
jgi:hypothetical protein